MNSIKVFVLVPSFISTGPIKGAVALCNGLVNSSVDVTFVSLKPADSNNLDIDKRVKKLSLGTIMSWKQKYLKYKQILYQESNEKRVYSISFCFSADMINFLMAGNVNILSCVRANNIKNYYYDYGLPGIFLAYFHYFILRRFNHVIAISDSMERQLKSLGLSYISTIKNFIDEISLEKLRKNKKDSKPKQVKFIFLGSLSKRKRVDLLIDAIDTLIKKGLNCSLDLLGDGILRRKLEKQVDKAGLRQYVKFHGNLKNPYDILQESHCLIIPSESEGISRAALEALFFNIPCILRNVDGNSELIDPGVNGDLFFRDEDLTDVMYRMTQHDFADKGRQNMLPDDFRQETNVRKFYELINKL
jgi:glycosyltransferase involved in cell wall biosynthesis